MNTIRIQVLQPALNPLAVRKCAQQGTMICTVRCACVICCVVALVTWSWWL